MKRFSAEISSRPSNALSPLTIPTYENSGQTTHPDIIDFGDSPFNGHRFWMVNTPYPNLDATKENPSIWVSSDGLTWQVPSGLTNPIVAWPGVGFYNDDPCLVYDSINRKLIVFYNQRLATPEFHRIESTDGITWSNDQIVITPFDYASNQTYFNPSDGSYVMWAISNDNPGFHGLFRFTSADGINWSAGTQVPLRYPQSWEPWHFSLKKIDGRFIGVVNAFPTGSGNTGCVKLFVIKSTDADGTDFYLEEDALLNRSSTGAWDVSTLYKSLLLRDEDGRWRLWYTGWITSGTTTCKLGHIYLSSPRRKPRSYTSSLNFDGATGYVRIPHASQINLGATTSSYTVAAWIKTSSRVAGTSIIEKWFGAAGPSPIMIRTSTATGGSTSNINFKIYDGTNNPAVDTRFSTQNGQWHEIVCVRSVGDDRLYIYVDGWMAKYTADTTTGTCANATDLMIGARNTTTAFSQCLVSDVRIWNVVLTGNQILNMYTSGDIPSTGLVARYQLSEGSGTTAIDSVSGNNGTITAATYDNDRPS